MKMSTYEKLLEAIEALKTHDLVAEELIKEI
jgi:hypothetical protein